VIYLLRGAHIKLDVLWNWEAPPDAGDTHHAVYRGTRARVEVRQGAEEKYRPELYVVPDAAFRADVAAALRRRGAAIAAEYPGVAVEDLGSRFLVRIPDRYRVGHEAHFAQVTRQFLEYLQDPSAIPAWEASAMLAKYRVTTEGVEVSRL
jgi:hypothetical protein